jgi:60 kDa SS-A/Ro ribonucleoprotein
MYKTLKNSLPGAAVPQTQPVPGRESEMHPSESGGFVFSPNLWEKLDRFLILGSETAYYANGADMTKQATETIKACLDQDGRRTVDRIVEVSQSGRAVKNDPALYALALAAGAKDKATREHALKALPLVTRTGTHLFHFLEFVDSSRKWSRMLRTAVSRWYLEKSTEKLAYQVVKYRQRDGWTHRDVIRLAHPKPTTLVQETVLHWLSGAKGGDTPLPRLIEDFGRLQACTTVEQVLEILKENPELPWESIPTNFTTDARVWEALLPNMPQTALIRNLSRMTAYELLKNGTEATRLVIQRLQDQAWLKSGKVHPFSLFIAQSTYRAGKGVKGKLTWEPVSRIVDAMEDAFYLTYENVLPVGKSLLLAVDVSGSMKTGEIAGLPGVSPRTAAAAMALITVATEPDVKLVGFDTEIYPHIDITPKTRLNDAVNKFGGGGGTDCSLPAQYAVRERKLFEGLVIYTDNQSWAGTNEHTYQSVAFYRKQKNPNFRAVAAALVAYDATILDPADPLSLNVVGMDTAAPGVMADFLADRLGKKADTPPEATEDTEI